jgi:beta-mannosidase
LKVEVKSNELVVKTEKPVKGLTFEEREGVLSDSAINVIPGDEQIVKVIGMKGDKPLEWIFLGMNE